MWYIFSDVFNNFINIFISVEIAEHEQPDTYWFQELSCTDYFILTSTFIDKFIRANAISKSMKKYIIQNDLDERRNKHILRIERIAIREHSRTQLAREVTTLLATGQE